MEDTSENKSAEMSLFSKLLAVLIVLALGTGVFFYSQTHALSKDPNKANSAKIAALVQKVSMIIDLPKGETPVLATVTDLAPLAGNPFFANAKVGDDVLLYPVAGQAFLYDPVANIIVDVAPLNIGKK